MAEGRRGATLLALAGKPSSGTYWESASSVLGGKLFTGRRVTGVTLLQNHLRELRGEAAGRCARQPSPGKLRTLQGAAENPGAKRRPPATTLQRPLLTKLQCQQATYLRD